MKTYCRLIVLAIGLTGAIACTGESSECFQTGFPPTGYTCPQDDADTGSTTPVAQVTWEADTLSLTITDGIGYDFWFGMVQNDEECVDDKMAADGDTICWEGEACLSSGICHPAGSSGITLEYSKGGVSGALAGTTDVNPGSNTAFADSTYENLVTYYLEDRRSAQHGCWVWGLDVNYYLELNPSCKQAS